MALEICCIANLRRAALINHALNRMLRGFRRRSDATSPCAAASTSVAPGSAQAPRRGGGSGEIMRNAGRIFDIAQKWHTISRGNWGQPRQE